ISEGEIHRHLKKSLKIYKERRDDSIGLIKQFFENEISFSIPSGGLALWLQFNKNISLKKLADECKKNNLFIPRICLYQSKNVRAIRLGFGKFSKEELQEVIYLLHKSYANILNDLDYGRNDNKKS